MGALMCPTCRHTLMILNQLNSVWFIVLTTSDWCSSAYSELLVSMCVCEREPLRPAHKHWTPFLHCALQTIFKAISRGFNIVNSNQMVSIKFPLWHHIDFDNCHFKNTRNALKSSRSHLDTLIPIALALARPLVSIVPSHFNCWLPIQINL